MTTAPANLLAVRRLLLQHLDVDPDTGRSQDLEPDEVGIVGDPAHRGGYHCGSDRVVTNDYSVVESSRDRNGLTRDAAALDVGLFQVRSGGGTHDLHSFSRWCVAQCVADAPDARDLREIIYSPDGRTVRRWDRLRRRTTGDSSHLWHTHFSFFRDSIKARRDQTPLFRRYLTSIGVIPDPGQETDMTELTRFQADAIEYIDGRVLAMATGSDTVRADLLGGGGPVWIVSTLKSLLAEVRALRPAIAAEAASPAEVRAILAAQPPISAQLVAAEVLKVLTPAAIAAAIPPNLAEQVAAELAARLAE